VEATRLRRHEAKLAQDALNLNFALKKEIERSEPQIWQARASVELVHDLNNPLTVVIGYAGLMIEETRQLALKNPGTGQKALEYAGLVAKAAEYCHHLSENWRLSSRSTAEFSTVDAVTIAEDVRQVLFFGNAAIQIAGEPTALVRGSKYELMRIFQNVFKNALEAGASAVNVVFASAGDRISVTMTDNGPGMDADRIKRVMHGGFSSKASGTGLGLSICRHLAAAHGGKFELSSRIGQGTTVRLELPKAATGG